jgi:hypothetical protein
MPVVEDKSQLLNGINQTQSLMFSNKGIVKNCASNYAK